MTNIPGPRGALSEICGTNCNIDVEINRHVAILWLDRPSKHNALTYEMGVRLCEAVVRASDDSSIRAIAILGRGGSFCAGDDLESVHDWCAGKLNRAPFSESTNDALYLRICETLIFAKKPVIVGLSGVVAGAGLDLACAADVRIAGRCLKLGSRLIHVGHVGNVVLLQRIVGVGRATELYLSGDFIGAEKAKLWGLVSEVVDEHDVSDRVIAVASALSEGPTKDLRERSWGQPVEACLRLQDRYHIETHDRVRDAHIGISNALRPEALPFYGT